MSEFLGRGNIMCNDLTVNLLCLKNRKKAGVVES